MSNNLEILKEEFLGIEQRIKALCEERSLALQEFDRKRNELINSSDALRKKILKEKDVIRKKLPPRNTTKNKEVLIDTPIDGIEIFSVRVQNCLRSHCIITVGDLCSFTEYELSRIDNLGEKSVREIRQELREYGLSLKGE